MSEDQSHVDRVFTSWSIDQGGPLTRSITDASTSGLIEQDAAHWAIEPFVPITVDALVEYLCQRSEKNEEFSKVDLPEFREFSSRLENCLRQKTLACHHEFSHRYASIDPDSDCRIPSDLQNLDPVKAAEDPDEDPNGELENAPKIPKATDVDADDLMNLCDEVLVRAGYRKLEQDELEQCVGVASQWGVPLKVNFDIFRHLALYARGDIIGKRFRRRLRKLYRPELVDVPIYQRVVVLFQVDEDIESGEELQTTELHLRMFKNIPKLTPIRDFTVSSRLHSG